MTPVMTLDGTKALSRPVVIDCDLYTRLHRFLAPIAGGDGLNDGDHRAATRWAGGEAAAVLNSLERAAVPPGGDAEAEARAAGWFSDPW